MSTLIPFELLIFNKASEIFFTATLKGDRYATAYTKAERKFPPSLYIIVRENVNFLQWYGLVNAWIAPAGEFIPCGYMGHNDFATDFCSKMGWEPDGYSYPYQVLTEKNWLRLLTWSNDPRETILIADDYSTLPNSAQTATAKDWAAINQVPFKSLFKSHETKTLSLYLLNN